MDEVLNMDNDFIKKNFNTIFLNISFDEDNKIDDLEIVEFLKLIKNKNIKTTKEILKIFGENFKKITQKEKDEIINVIKEDKTLKKFHHLGELKNFSDKELDEYIKKYEKTNENINENQKKIFDNLINKFKKTKNIKREFNDLKETEQSLFMSYIIKNKKNDIYKFFVENNIEDPNMNYAFDTNKTLEMNKILIGKSYGYLVYIKKEHKTQEMFDIAFASYQKKGKNNLKEFINIFNTFDFTDDPNKYLYCLSKLVDNNIDLKNIKNTIFWSNIANSFREKLNNNVNLQIENKYRKLFFLLKNATEEYIKYRTVFMGGYDKYENTKEKSNNKKYNLKENFFYGIKELDNEIAKEITEIINGKGKLEEKYKKIYEKLEKLEKLGLQSKDKEKIFNEIARRLKDINEKELEKIKNQSKKYDKFIPENIKDKNGGINEKKLLKEYQDFYKNKKIEIENNPEKYKDFLNKNGKIDESKIKELFLNNLNPKNEELRNIYKKSLKIASDGIIHTKAQGSYKEFKRFLENYEKYGYTSIIDYEQDLKDEKITEKDYNPNQENITQNTNISFSDYVYNSETGIITSEELNGKTIKLSNKDKKIIENNPEALKNLVNFSEVLQKVGLLNLWNIKEQVFKAIGNVEGQSFETNGDYLNENEIMIFLNSILTSIGKKKVDTGTGLDDMIGNFKNINNFESIGGGFKRDSMYGNTSIEKTFIDTFIPKGNYTGFLLTKFENAISEGQK